MYMNTKITAIAALASLALAAGFLSGCKKNADKGGNGEPPVEETGKCPFSKGMNLGDWFTHEDLKWVKEHAYSEMELKNIRSLGTDVIRVPVYFHPALGPAPEYTLNEEFLAELDKAVDLAKATDMWIIIDNHSKLWNLSQAVGENNVRAAVCKVWEQVAGRYAGKYGKIVYELQNEPGDTYYKTNWLSMQNDYLKAVRSKDTDSYVIVTPVHGEPLSELPEFDDKRLIATFHFYSPFLFTHQGADWTNPKMEIAPVAFPYDAATMPAMPASWKGNEEFEKYYSDYAELGNAAALRALIDKHIEFSKSRNMPVFCGEFGVLDCQADVKSKAIWNRIVAGYLKNNGIAWTYWSYNGDFSIFRKNSGKNFDTDLEPDVVKALGLILPKSYDSDMPAEITLYDDVLPKYSKNGSWNGSDTDKYYQISFEDTNEPFDGSKCIQWKVGTPYGAVTFEMWPVQDWTRQAEKDYSLTFAMRTSETFKGDIVVRFQEYDSVTTEQWRYGFKLNNTDIPADGQWHKITKKMSELQCLGTRTPSWHDPDPTRACKWNIINKLEFAAEGNNDLVGKTFGIDAVYIKKNN